MFTSSHMLQMAMTTQFFSRHVVHQLGPLPNCDDVFHCPDVSSLLDYTTIPNHELDFLFFLCLAMVVVVVLWCL